MFALVIGEIFIHRQHAAYRIRLMTHGIKEYLHIQIFKTFALSRRDATSVYMYGRGFRSQWCSEGHAQAIYSHHTNLNVTTV